MIGIIKPINILLIQTHYLLSIQHTVQSDLIWIAEKCVRGEIINQHNLI